MRRTLRLAVLTGVLVVAGAVIGLGGIGTAQSPPATAEGLAAGLACPADDLILIRENVRAAGAGAESQSERGALARLLAREYPGLRAESFAAQGQGDSRRLVRNRDGRADAAARVDRAAGGWVLEAFVACNSALTGGRR